MSEPPSAYDVTSGSLVAAGFIRFIPTRCNHFGRRDAGVAGSRRPPPKTARGRPAQAARPLFAGVVRKKLGLTLVSEKTGSERTYRIAVKSPARKSRGRRRAA